MNCKNNLNEFFLEIANATFMNYENAEGQEMDEKELLVIIPAYNEEKNIGSVLDELEKPEIAGIADVLIMNDASSDSTNWVAKARGHAVVTHVFNLGYGSGIQLGYKYAIRRGYKYVIQMDADEEYDASKLNTAEYQMLNFSLVANLQEGDNVLTLTTAPSEGMKVLAVLRDASDDNTDYVSNALVVEKAGSGSEQPTTPEGSW